MLIWVNLQNQIGAAWSSRTKWKSRHANFQATLMYVFEFILLDLLLESYYLVYELLLLFKAYYILLMLACRDIFLLPSWIGRPSLLILAKVCINHAVNLIVALYQVFQKQIVFEALLNHQNLWPDLSFPKSQSKLTLIPRLICSYEHFRKSVPSHDEQY